MIEAIHKCKAVHERSVVLLDMFKCDTVRLGVVESFSLEGHPKAERCYAWSHHENGQTQFVNVLEIPPVVPLQTAIKVASASKSKKKK